MITLSGIRLAKLLALKNIPFIASCGDDETEALSCLNFDLVLGFNFKSDGCFVTSRYECFNEAIVVDAQGKPLAFESHLDDISVTAMLKQAIDVNPDASKVSGNELTKALVELGIATLCYLGDSKDQSSVSELNMGIIDSIDDNGMFYNQSQSHHKWQSAIPVSHFGFKQVQN